MKESCIDWLIKSYFGGLVNCTPHFRKYIEKAKELHKQEIIEAYCDWKRIVDKLPSRSAEEYYKITYEKD